MIYSNSMVTIWTLLLFFIFFVDFVGVILYKVFQKLQAAVLLDDRPPKPRFLIGVTRSDEFWDKAPCFQFSIPQTLVQVSFAHLIEVMVISVGATGTGDYVSKQRAHPVVCVRISSPFITRQHACLKSPFSCSHFINNFVTQSRSHAHATHTLAGGGHSEGGLPPFPLPPMWRLAVWVACR